jgi:hypothetical protein
MAFGLAGPTAYTCGYRWVIAVCTVTETLGEIRYNPHPHVMSTIAVVP